MERDYFVYKTHCELEIISDEVNPDLITDELNISPIRSFKKGEITTSKHSTRTGRKPHNLWAIKSESFDTEEESISQHIEYFKSILLPRIDILKKYKEDPRFEISFWIWIETDNAGIGIELNEDEISFLNSFSNRIHFSFITKNEIVS